MMHGLDPAPDVIARIDALAAASRAAPGDDAAYVELWRALFALERWICIARGADEQPSPFALGVPQGPTVLVFTTAERARAAGLASGLPPAEAARLLASPLPATIDWLASMQAIGITGILMDHGSIGGYLPIANLPAMRDWFAANPR